MVRVIAVLVAVVILLTLGWYIGHRPVPVLRTQLAASRADCQKQAADLERRALDAEARGYLWQARAEILLAAHDVEQRNYGTATDRATQARDLLTRTAGTAGVTLDLGSIRDMVDSAVGKLGAAEPGARDVLLRAASELGRILEKAGQA